MLFRPSGYVKIINTPPLYSFEVFFVNPATEIERKKRKKIITTILEWNFFLTLFKFS